MSSWDVAWTPTATRSLAALPEKVAAAAIEFVYGPMSENPHRAGKPLRFELEGLHVGRRGDYRVIYEVDAPALRIIIHAVEHRADAYRSR